MWNINDVRVGYDNDQAKKFNLDGSDMKSPIETLPKLSVDQELPYMRLRRKTQDPAALIAQQLAIKKEHARERQKTSHMRAGGNLINSLALDMSAEDQLAQTANTFFSN